MNEPVNGLQIDLLKVWKPRNSQECLSTGSKQIHPKCGNLGAYSQECLSRDSKQIYLEYENLGISHSETEKEHLKYHEHPEKTTQNQPFTYH
jgi:hypothetical protein